MMTSNVYCLHEKQNKFCAQQTLFSALTLTVWQQVGYPDCKNYTSVISKSSPLDVFGGPSPTWSQCFTLSTLGQG